MRNDQRKLQKRKERERRVRSEREVRSERRRIGFNEKLMRDAYKLPDFPIEAFGAPEGAVSLVRNAMELLKIRFPKIIEETWLVYLRDYRKSGWRAAVDAAYKDAVNDPVWAGKQRDDTESALKHFIETALGGALVQCMPNKLIRQVMPFSGFNFELKNDVWIIKIRSLEHGHTDHGGVYYSPHKPYVDLSFGRRFVGFSRHAAQQMCDRIVPNWHRSYVGINHVFGFLYECVYFEPTWLPNGQAGFSVWNGCNRIGREFWEKAKVLAKTTDDRRDQYYYRVGYCPVSVDRGVAVAKTFLAPGYQSTPEKDLFRQKFQNPQKIAPLELAADDGINVIRAIEDPKTWAAIEWFHKHGVPQVMQMGFEVFRKDALSGVEADESTPPRPVIAEPQQEAG